MAPENGGLGNMDTGKDLQSFGRALFKLRVGDFFFERKEDVRFLDQFRASIRNDEKVRALFVNRILGGTDSPWEDFFTERREMLNVLLDEQPDSAQAKYLLNHIAFHPQGEDGMCTQNAHKIMAQRFADDPWFRRQVEQYGGGRNMGFSKGYFLSDLSDYNRHLLEEWAESDTKYLPMCFGIADPLFALCKHPDFKFDDFDLPDETRTICQKITNQPTYETRLGVLALQPKSDYYSAEKIFDSLASNLCPENIQTLCAVAENKSHSHSGRANIVLAKNAGKSRQISAWISEKSLSDSNNLSWPGILAQYCDDHDLALQSTRRLLGESGPAVSEYLLIAALRRFCAEPWTLPVSEGLPLIEQALSHDALKNRRPELLQILAETYPNHSDTRRILLAYRAASELRRIDGLSANVLNLALDHCAARAVLSEGIAAILSDSQSDQAFQILIPKAENSPDEEQATAIRALADGYSARAGVKELLIEKALKSTPGSHPQRAALLSLAWHFRHDRQTSETVLELATQQTYKDLPSQLLDFVSDPDYCGWLATRHEWKKRFEEKARNTKSENWFDRALGAYGLALWFGEDPEVISLHIESAKSHTGPLGQFYLRNMVMRWQNEPCVLKAIQSTLDNHNSEMRDEAAILLSRAYSNHPDTSTLLRCHISRSSIVFGEYIGLGMNRPEVMTEGLCVLQRLPDAEVSKEVALDGPMHLLRYFGPRKDLRDALTRLGAETANPHLQKGITKAFERFFPHRFLTGLNSSIAAARIQTLRSVVLDASSIEIVRQMSCNDRDPWVRLATAEALVDRAPKESWPAESVKDLVRIGLPGAISLLARISSSESILDWLITQVGDLLNTNPQIALALTQTVAKFFFAIKTGWQYLMDRAGSTKDVVEFNCAIPPLCRLYHQHVEVQAFLDKHLYDLRLDGTNASAIMETQIAKVSDSKKIDHYLAVLNDKDCPPKAEAQRVAPGSLCLLICHHGSVPYGSPDAARVINELVAIMENHPREDVRLHTWSVLGLLVYEAGSDWDARIKKYPDLWKAYCRQSQKNFSNDGQKPAQ
jgi:hypothetical protein